MVGAAIGRSKGYHGLDSLPTIRYNDDPFAPQ